MKRINMLLTFSLLLVSGVFLSSCQKDEVSSNDQLTSSQLKLVPIVVDCDVCVPTWQDTKMVWNSQYFVPQSVNNPYNPNLFLEVYNDQTTLYLRVYTTSTTDLIDRFRYFNNPVFTEFAPPVAEYSWTEPLPADWEPCDEIPLNFIVGTFHHSGNVNFCQKYILRDICEGEVECSDETAWAFGPRYVTKGNWATYTPYVAGSTVNIYAGQTHLAGTATFSAVINGQVTITINLSNGASFNDVEENLKIQGYSAVPPASNPAPGQFTYKSDESGTSATVTVAAAAYYGIHLDVSVCVPVEY